jgi:UDP-3-O-[3-hydroxymyristoyl] glucosamine N-acyltransferase
MEKTLKELSEIAKGKLAGNGDLKIRGVGTLQNAKEGEITFLSDEKEKELLLSSKASAFVVPETLEVENLNLIKVKNPRLAFARIMEVFAPKKELKGIHQTAIIGENVQIGENVFISAYTFVGDRCKIGNNVKIYPFVYLGDEVEIGDDTLIYPQVVIRENCKIGKRVIIHPGAVIGADGYGFVKDDDPLRGCPKHYKIPQIGNVIIEDDVEIGANCCIDRAMLDSTIVKRGTKFDNLVQVGHNDIIGEDCLIVAQVGLSGSVVIGDRVILAGQAGVSDHITIGSDSIIGGQAGVTRNVPPNSFYSGYPAAPHEQQKKIQAALRQLPEILEKIKDKL